MRLDEKDCSFIDMTVSPIYGGCILQRNIHRVVRQYGDGPLQAREKGIVDVVNRIDPLRRGCPDAARQRDYGSQSADSGTTR